MTQHSLINIATHISIDPNLSIAIYIQIAEQIATAIQRGHIMLGSKLPGSRILSHQLQINRQTAIAVYKELEALGWVESLPNKGTFITKNLENIKASRFITCQNKITSYPSKTGFSFKQSSIIDTPYDSINFDLAFTDGTPDIRLTSFHDLTSMYSASMKRKQTQRKMEYHNHLKSDFFQAQLSNYLNSTRGLHISYKNLLVTRSPEMSLYILSQLLIQHKDLVLVAELNHFFANMIFQKAGAQIVKIPLDDQGIIVQHIRTHFTKNEIRILYITPHHHYPTTVTLSRARRKELLNLAYEYNFIIIEDDYDFDFQYNNSAVVPLASADTNGMVIYVGSFGRSLAPGFRSGFVVAPENFMHEMRKYLEIIDRQGDIVMEQVLGEIISEGTIFKHLKKSLKIYKERRDYFCKQLEQYFTEDLVSYTKPNGGLALWTHWNPKISLLKLSHACKIKGLHIPQTLLYQNKYLSAMRLGFGHLNESEVNKAFVIMQQSIKKIKEGN